MARRRRRFRKLETVTVSAPRTRGEALKHRARRCAGKGEYRKAALALREAVALEGDAASWALLGDMLRRARRPSEAAQAFKQAEWLHRRAGAPRRAAVVARLLGTLAA